MQWAQRSRECPLCFRGLALEDEDMNALLPFGEYVSPEQRAAEQATLETWELERLLLRLAAASQREHARAHRSARRASASAAGGGGGSGRHRRQGSRGEASAPQPIRSSGDAAAALGGSHGWLIAGEAASSSSSSAAGRPASAPPPGYPSPSSWQHVGGEPEPGSSGRGMVDEGHVVSPTARSGSFSLKSRLASLRLKCVGAASGEGRARCLGRGPGRQRAALSLAACQQQPRCSARCREPRPVSRHTPR